MWEQREGEDTLVQLSESPLLVDSCLSFVTTPKSGALNVLYSHYLSYLRGILIGPLRRYSSGSLGITFKGR